MTRVMLTDISPDWVRIAVDWDKFIPGSSVFIPCINTKRAIDHLVKALRIDRGAIEKRVCVENGKYGVRVWRMK